MKSYSEKIADYFSTQFDKNSEKMKAMDELSMVYKMINSFINYNYNLKKGQDPEFKIINEKGIDPINKSYQIEKKDLPNELIGCINKQKNFSLEDTLKNFKSERSKKIVILELMILIHIDRNFNINEQILMDKISQCFGLELENLDDYSQWGKSVAMLYEVAKVFIDDRDRNIE